MGEDRGCVRGAGSGGVDEEAEVEEGADERCGDGHILAEERVDDGVPGGP